MFNYRLDLQIDINYSGLSVWDLARLIQVLKLGPAVTGALTFSVN